MARDFGMVTRRHVKRKAYSIGSPYSGFSYNTNLVGGLAIHSDYRAQQMAAAHNQYDPEKSMYRRVASRLIYRDHITGRDRMHNTYASTGPSFRSRFPSRLTTPWAILTKPTKPWADLTKPTKPWGNLTQPTKPWSNLTKPVEVKFGNYSVPNMSPEYSKNWNLARANYEKWQRVYSDYVWDQETHTSPTLQDPWFGLTDLANRLAGDVALSALRNQYGVFNDAQWAHWYNTKSNQPPPDSWDYSRYNLYKAPYTKPDL